MASNAQTHRGIIHGRTIELDHDTGLSDGQEVVVTVQALTGVQQPVASSEGIRRSSGGWSDDPQGLEDFLAWNRDRRKSGRPEIAF